MSLIARPLSKFVQNLGFAHWLHKKIPRLLSGAFVRQLTERIGADALRFFMLPIIEQKANAAQNAGAQCAPLRARRRNAQFLFSATL